MTALAAAWNWTKGAAHSIAEWFQKNPGALFALLGAAVGAFFVYRSSKNRIAALEDALEVEANRRKVAKLEAQAETLEKQAEAKEPEVKRLKAEIATSKRKVAEIEAGEKLEGLTDEEIAERFTNAGF